MFYAIFQFCAKVKCASLDGNIADNDYMGKVTFKTSLTEQFGDFLIDASVRKDEIAATHCTSKLKIDTNILKDRLFVLLNLHAHPAVRPFNQQWPFLQK